MVELICDSVHCTAWQELNSEKLVPGDVIAVSSPSMMECDAVLLDGLVICNESMLTGNDSDE